MIYETKNFQHLLGLNGFSEKLLQAHFGLYEGYVKNTNLLMEKLKSFDNTQQAVVPEHAELRRRFGWEWNGMRLHELYFGNMTVDEKKWDKTVGVFPKLVEQFGSVDAWRADFVSAGKMRGIGWVILAKDMQTGQLHNTWINEHDLGHLAGTTPLLVMDVFEHAFIMDYGMDRGSYINAFMDAIDWNVVSSRMA
ncbi:MAG: superoxide dismutase [Candidatus Moranbacteria bacterium]|nr:superoxide dismutase [Candidatus Moranbacteria bacterium]